MARIRQVAVTFPLARDHLTRVMRGVTDYAQQHGNWSLHVNPELPSTPVRHWRAGTETAPWPWWIEPPTPRSLAGSTCRS